MTKIEIAEVLSKSAAFLNGTQLEKLNQVLNGVLEREKNPPSNKKLLKLFETAKNVEGCSPKSVLLQNKSI